MHKTQTKTHIRGNSPSTISIMRQFQRSSSQPESGAEKISDIGIAIEKREFARARSLRGNQCESKTSVDAYMPLSAIPNKKRIAHICCQVRTRPQPTAAAPHATSKILTNHFVLQRVARYPPGTCRARYPQKKAPTIIPP